MSLWSLELVLDPIGGDRRGGDAERLPEATERDPWSSPVIDSDKTTATLWAHALRAVRSACLKWALHLVQRRC